MHPLCTHQQLYYSMTQRFRQGLVTEKPLIFSHSFTINSSKAALFPGTANHSPKKQYVFIRQYSLCQRSLVRQLETRQYLRISHSIA